MNYVCILIRILFKLILQDPINNMSEFVQIMGDKPLSQYGLSITVLNKVMSRYNAD